jgi:hypothetical protein
LTASGQGYSEFIRRGFKDVDDPLALDVSLFLVKESKIRIVGAGYCRKGKIKYKNEPIGKVRLGEDFLPSMDYESDSMAALFLPFHEFKISGLVEPLQHFRAYRLKLDVLAHTKLTDNPGRDDLTGLAEVADARCEIHGGTEKRVAIANGLAGSDTNSGLQRHAICPTRVVHGQLALNRDRAFYGSMSGSKARQKSITRAIDLPSPMVHESPADDVSISAHEAQGL